MALLSFVAALACLALLYTLMPRLPRGLPRLLLLLPCLPVFAWVPFSTRSHLLRSNLTFSFFWICPSKLLLLSWDLSPENSLSHGFVYFLVTTILPVHVKGKASTSASTKQGALFPSLLNFLLFLLVLNACGYKDRLSLWQIHALYSLLVFFGLELLLDFAAKLAIVLLGVETYPHSDNPFVASSLSDFWSRRWNLVATRMLRLAVYAPILRFLSGSQGQDAGKNHKYRSCTEVGKLDAGTTQAETKMSSSSKELMQNGGLELQKSIIEHHDVQPQSFPCIGHGTPESAARHSLPMKAIAMLATFLVSGLIHELIFGCMNLAQPSWEVTMFFILHGLATVLEGFLRRELPAGWKLPRPVSIFCTLGFVFFTTAWLFMPPLTRTGSDARIIAEFDYMQSVIIDLFKRQ